MKYKTGHVIGIFLYMLALVLTLTMLISNWAVAVTSLLILAITLLQKIKTDEDMEETKRKFSRITEIVTTHLDDISKKIGTEFQRHALAVEARITGQITERIAEERDKWKADIELSYKDITRKIVDIENKHNSLKRTVGAGLGALEDRIKTMEMHPAKPVIEIAADEEKELEDRLSDIFGREK